jgi:hypothetical protein
MMTRSPSSQHERAARRQERLTDLANIARAVSLMEEFTPHPLPRDHEP